LIVYTNFFKIARGKMKKARQSGPFYERNYTPE